MYLFVSVSNMRLCLSLYVTYYRLPIKLLTLYSVMLDYTILSYVMLHFLGTAIVA